MRCKLLYRQTRVPNQQENERGKGVEQIKVAKSESRKVASPGTRRDVGSDEIRQEGQRTVRDKAQWARLTPAACHNA